MHKNKIQCQNDLFLILFALFLLSFLFLFLFLFAFFAPDLPFFAPFFAPFASSTGLDAAASFCFFFFLNSRRRAFKSAFLPCFVCCLLPAFAFFLSSIAFFLCSALSFFFRNKSCNDNPSMPRSDFNVRLFLLFLPDE